MHVCVMVCKDIRGSERVCESPGRSMKIGVWCVRIEEGVRGCLRIKKGV